jgi:hypothetical protein
MSRGLFRLVGVRSVCWVVRDASRTKHVHWHHLGILTSNGLLNHIITNPQKKKKTYNLTLRHVHATIVAVQINKHYVFWVCVFRLRYLKCNTHATYCHLWPARLFIIFHIISLTARFSETKVKEHKMCFGFLYNFCLQYFSFLRITGQHMIKNVYWSSRSTCYSCKILMKVEFSG